MNKSMRRAGFTLVEVLLVIALLAALATVGVLAVTKIQAAQHRKIAKLQVDDTVHALDIYCTQMSKYPDSDKGLEALITPPDDEKEKEKWMSGNGGAPYLKDGKIPVDPWGNPLKYQLVEGAGGVTSGPSVHVWSVGPDGQDGNEDDIRNWSDETK